MKYLSILLIGCICLFSCKTKKLNQTLEKKRDGIWVEEYAIDSAHYKSVGKYKNDNPIKTWRYFLDNKLIKKEKYNALRCKTKCYHQNRKIEAKGITRLEENNKLLHWYYDRTWKYYNEKRKLITTRNYKKGTLISEENK